jgi:hypothetical protein
MHTTLSALEARIVQIIEDGLRSKSVDASRAKAISKACLSELRSQMNEFQLYQAAQGLATHFPELTEIVVAAGEHYENQVRDAVVQHTSGLIQAGNLEQATSLIATALNKTQEIRPNG